MKKAPESIGLTGVKFTSMLEVIEFSSLMAASAPAVPVHLQDNPGACLAICVKALRFGFDPFSLAEHSYLAEKLVGNGSDTETVQTIAYDSFVIRAIIQAHAPIIGNLEFSYEGEGDARKCTVTATPKDGGKIETVTSPTLGELRKARAGKGSSLWETKSDQQLGYDTGRDFCRLYHPEILLGWYDKDEMAEYGNKTIKIPAKPKVGARLKGQKNRAGFSAASVSAALGDTPPAPAALELNLTPVVETEAEESATVEIPAFLLRSKVPVAVAAKSEF